MPGGPPGTPWRVNNRITQPTTTSLAQQHWVTVILFASTFASKLFKLDYEIESLDPLLGAFQGLFFFIRGRADPPHILEVRI